MNALRRRFKAALLVAVASVMLSGCDFNVYELPLPGGTDVGDNPMTVTVMFEDVLDLVPKSTVKVNDVSVGMVSDIQLDGQVAKVTLELQDDVKLPDDAEAQIRQTSLLGEKFVSLGPPSDGGSDEPLESGDTIPLERSGRNPEVEEVLGALSLLLNGGGVGQLQTINRELNHVLEGREDSARSVFRQIEELMGQFDANKEDIVDAIESLNRLAIATKAQLPTIDATLEQLPSALRTIDAQRGDLVKMLKALNRLGDVGIRVIKASKDSTIESFRQLVPVLTELSNTGDNFAKSFHVFLTYPFVDDVVGKDPQVARNLHMGDYTNLSVKLDVDLPGLGGGGGPGGPPPVNTVCTTLQDLKDELPNDTPLNRLERLLDSDDLCQGVARKLQRCIDDPSLAMCEGLPKKALRQAIREIKQACEEFPDNPICDAIPEIPSGPDGPLSGVPGTQNPLGGGNRTGFGPTDSGGARGPTMGELMKTYDPALVALLVPGMVTR
jgi:phospholipid/cholesterol/gamma-HCH transport system substrate-binding protein